MHTHHNVSRDAVTVRLPRDLVERVRALALAHERSLSAELRVALAAYIAQHAEGE